MAELTPREQLAETEKQMAELAEKAEALKKQTRAEDLELVRQLVRTHGFTATDLRSALKTSRSPRKSSAAKAAPKSRSKRK